MESRTRAVFPKCFPHLLRVFFIEDVHLTREELSADVFGSNIISIQKSSGGHNSAEGSGWGVSWWSVQAMDGDFGLLSASLPDSPSLCSLFVTLLASHCT